MRDMLRTWLMIAFVIPAASADEKTWDALRELEGEWVGEGTGQPGVGSGGFSITYDVQKTILVRRNFAEYPATKDRPAFRHDDLMIMYRTPSGDTRADYWDNERHIIHYSVLNRQNEIILTSDPASGEPRFRFTYVQQERGRLKMKFEIAPPGKPDDFKPYIEAAARRKEK